MASTKGVLQAIIKANLQKSQLRQSIIIKASQPASVNVSPKSQAAKIKPQNKITVQQINGSEKRKIIIPSNFATEPSLDDLDINVPKLAKVDKAEKREEPKTEMQDLTQIALSNRERRLPSRK